jgi:sugar phosphate isomerase/epimerase
LCSDPPADLLQGGRTVQAYVKECRCLGFDTVELPDAAGLGLPDRDLYILMHDVQQVLATCHLDVEAIG